MSNCDTCSTDSESCKSSGSSCSGDHADTAQNEQAQLQQNLAIRLEGIKHKLIVMSGKGGVGKSTTAVNLAYALVEKGFKVGLLDIDLHGPSVPTMCGLAGERPMMSEEGILPMVVSGLKLMSIGFLLQSAGQATIMRGPMKHGAIMQLLADVVWDELDYLLVDCPPGTGDEPLSAVQLLGKNAAAVVVTTPQDVALVDVEKSLSFCNELKLPVVGLIENMSGFICPHCNKLSDIFKSGGGDKLAKKTGVAMLAKVPLDPRVVAAGDDGKPHILACPDSKCSEALREAAAAVVAFDGI